MSSRPASKTPLNIAWSPRSIFRSFLINFGHMWEEKTIKKQWRGLQNQALHTFGPDRVSEQILERFCSYFEPFPAHFVAIWAPPEPSWARPGGASSPLWYHLGCKGYRTKKYQFRRPHLEPAWTPQGVNLTPKRRPNELQTCSRPAL